MLALHGEEIVSANNHGMLALMERMGLSEKEDPDLRVVGLGLQ